MNYSVLKEKYHLQCDHDLMDKAFVMPFAVDCENQNSDTLEMHNLEVLGQQALRTHLLFYLSMYFKHEGQFIFRVRDDIEYYMYHNFGDWSNLIEKEKLYGLSFPELKTVVTRVIGILCLANSDSLMFNFFDTVLSGVPNLYQYSLKASISNYSKKTGTSNPFNTSTEIDEKGQTQYKCTLCVGDFSVNATGDSKAEAEYAACVKFQTKAKFKNYIRLCKNKQSQKSCSLKKIPEVRKKEISDALSLIGLKCPNDLYGSIDKALTDDSYSIDSDIESTSQKYVFKNDFSSQLGASYLKLYISKIYFHNHNLSEDILIELTKNDFLMPAVNELVFKYIRCSLQKRVTRDSYFRRSIIATSYKAIIGEVVYTSLQNKYDMYNMNELHDFLNRLLKKSQKLKEPDYVSQLYTLAYSLGARITVDIVPCNERIDARHKVNLTYENGNQLMKEVAVGYTRDRAKKIAAQNMLLKLTRTLKSSTSNANTVQEFGREIIENVNQEKVSKNSVNNSDSLTEKILDKENNQDDFLNQKSSYSSFQNKLLEKGGISNTTNISKYNHKSKTIEIISKQYHRNAELAEFVKICAQGICELCNKPAPFLDLSGKPYLESHHVIWLSDGGPDSILNVVALCPACHRKMHIVNDYEDFNIIQKKAAEHTKYFAEEQDEAL